MSAKHSHSRRVVRCASVAVLLVAMAPGLAQAFWGRKPKLPDWVTAPDTVEQTYPQSRYFVGFGVCGGASAQDLMSRKQAESSAISDIASYVEIKINDVIEQHDTTVMRNQKELVQSVTHQQTRREVTGLLSGVEIKEVFFNKRTMNWHAMAVLERARAGRGALEAIDQRIKRGEQVLAPGEKTPLRDYLELREINAVAAELDRLVIAIALFAPSQTAAVKARVDGFKKRLQDRLNVAGKQVTIDVTVSGSSATGSADIRATVERVLNEHGFSTGRGSRQLMEIIIVAATEIQHGAVKLVSVRTGGRYGFREEGRELMSGVIESSEITMSRADSPEKATQRSLAKFGEELGKAMADDLAHRYGPPPR